MSQDQPQPLGPTSPNSSETPERSETQPAPTLEIAPDETTETAIEPVPASSETEPSRPARINTRSTPENDEILPQTLLRLMGETIVAAQPLLKQQGIKALRGTIHLLEKAVERLEAEPIPKPARRSVPSSETASENPLPRTSPTHTDRLAPLLSTDRLRQKFQTSWQQLWRSWRPLLRQIRARLPVSINRNVSDRALTGAIAGILILLLWTVSSLLPATPQPTTVAPTPSAEPVVSSPAPTPMPIPPLIQAPEASKPVEISPTPTIKPSISLPPLKVTPEQTLIARIQDQVSAISQQYASGLVQSVQANFRSSRLLVNISDGWYDLSRSQQDSLAGEMLRRTQDLDFLKLELVDEAGMLLARSPIVGTEMILLKRARSPM